MKKTILLIIAALFSTMTEIYAQVGINNQNPTATLDIVAKSTTGTTTNVDGLLIPRVDRGRAQSMTAVPLSTMIYVNSIATGTQAGTAVNIDAAGYYYNNGTLWIKLNPGINIYNSDGTLTGSRTVTQGASTLAFTGTSANAFSVAGTTFSVDAANNRVGIGNLTPQKLLHVNGALQVVNELNVGGNATTAGSAGTSGQVLTSNGAAAAPSWQTLSTVSGTIASANYVQGTTSATITTGTTGDVPGATITLTVPTGRTQTFLFNILGYATLTNGTSSQGVFSLLQDGVKISSAYVSKAGVFPIEQQSIPATPATINLVGLSSMPVPVTFIKAVTLTAGTYIFKVQYSAWVGDATVNYIPSTYGGYNGDTEAMLTKMQVLVYNN